MKQFDQDVAKQIAFKEATKRTPDYLPNTLAIIPLSVGVGIVVGIGVALICLGFSSSARSALILGGLAMAACVLFAFFEIFKKEIYVTTERIVGRDLNHDGYIGAPPQTHIQFQASERTTWMSTLPAPEHLILEWAAAALGGRSLGYRQWSRRFALLPDGSDGTRRYADFRDALVRSQLAIEGGKSGISLTERGIQQFTEYVHQRPRGTPLLDG